MMTQSQIKKYFGSIKAAADFFNVEPSAVYQWKKLPKRRHYELMFRRPEDFPPKLLK